MYATYPTQLIFLNFIKLTVSCNQYLLWSSWLCYFLQSPLASSVLGPNILLSTPFSNTLCQFLPIIWEITFIFM
jgi:hypothetical protein